MLLVQFGSAQVGIGTVSPTPGYSLDVDGSVLIQKEFKLGTLLETSQYEKFKFLMRLHNSSPTGEVVKLDLEQVAVAPINIFNYTFYNLQKDNVTSVNLQFDANKYFVGLSNFQYEGREIEKGISGSNYIYIGNFVSRTYVEGGTWHLEMRNRSRDAANDNTIVYQVTLIVYDKRHFKQLPSITVDFGGSETGAAPAPSGL